MKKNKLYLYSTFLVFIWDFFVSLQGRPEETGEAFEDQEASPNGPTFNPALYIQRYLMVADTVADLCDQAIKEGRDSFKVSFDSSVFLSLNFGGGKKNV